MWVTLLWCSVNTHVNFQASRLVLSVSFMSLRHLNKLRMISSKFENKLEPFGRSSIFWFLFSFSYFDNETEHYNWFDCFYFQKFWKILRTSGKKGKKITKKLFLNLSFCFHLFFPLPHQPLTTCSFAWSYSHLCHIIFASLMLCCLQFLLTKLVGMVVLKTF